jgi:hypothetical protein
MLFKFSFCHPKNNFLIYAIYSWNRVIIRFIIAYGSCVDLLFLIILILQLVFYSLLDNRKNILTLTQLLDLLNDPFGHVEFDDSIALINLLYEFTPTSFRNGNAVNSFEQNHGSLKILTFGQLQGFTEQQTLLCFGGFYQDVVRSPHGDDHQNIREFMSTGWNGVCFDGLALTPIKSVSSRTGFN